MSDVKMSEQQQQQQQPEHPQTVISQPATTYTSPEQMNEKTSHQPQAVQQQQQQQQHQAAHQHSHGWSFSLWDCFKPVDICCLAFWCPCYLFGKTSERNQTSEKDPSGMNGMCCAWYALACCGFQPCFQTITRGEMRGKFSIDGNMGMDFLASCCCLCCVLVQEEKESIVRMTGVDPKTGAVYQAVPQMSHP